MLVDGGVIDPIPVELARTYNPKLVVAVDLSDLLRKDFSLNLFGVAKRSLEIKFLEQSRSCARNADILIRPEVGTFDTFDDRFNRRVFEAGREAALEAIPAIKKALEL
jgi:NTE family protein